MRRVRRWAASFNGVVESETRFGTHGRYISGRESARAKVVARAIPKCANAPVQQFQTTPLCSMSLRNSAAGVSSLPRGQESIGSYIKVVETGAIGEDLNIAKFDDRRSSEQVSPALSRRCPVSLAVLEADLQDLTAIAHEPSSFRCRKSDCPVASHSWQSGPGASFIGSPGR